MVRVMRSVLKRSEDQKNSRSVLPNNEDVVQASDKLMKLRFIEEQSPSSLLTPEQASLLINVTEGTLSVWRSTGRYKLKFVKCGRLIRYRLSDVKEFLELRTRTRTGAGGRDV